jgi:soluble lytic murein transglycosylase
VGTNVDRGTAVDRGTGVKASKAAPAASGSGLQPVASASSGEALPTDAAKAEADDDWRAKMRVGDFDGAYQAISKLTDDERKSPKMRLAEGRAALEVGRHADAVRLLEGLHTELPSVADIIQRWHAEAAAVAGPHEAAAGYLARSPKILDALAAAAAYERAGKLALARKQLDTAVKRAQRNRRKADHTTARWARAAFAEKQGKKSLAIADALWLVLHRPDEAVVRDALALVDRLGGRVKFDDRLHALVRSSTKANIESTLPTLDALGGGKSATQPKIALAKAKALYRARIYDKAADAFDEAATLPSAFSVEAAYYAARSLGRAGKGETAVKRYAKLARRFRKNMFAERASYRHAEQLLELGENEKAARAYAVYLSRYSRAADAHRARYSRALAHLAAGKPKQARPALSALHKRSSDHRERAMLQHLEAVASYAEGKHERAVKSWKQLAQAQPLTWTGMMARARLEAAKVKDLPPLMPSPKPSAALPLAASLPPGPALLHEIGLDLDAEDLLRAQELSAAKRYAGRESEALCAMYGTLACAERRQRVGYRAASWSLLMRAPSASERWAWSCVYPEAYPNLAHAEERQRKVPEGLAHAIMRQESAFMTEVVSPAGAIGLMQLMPNTAKLAADEIGMPSDHLEITRPHVNIRLGTYYIGKLLRTFDESLPLAVAAYNAGPQAVSRWAKGAEGLEMDLWAARIPYRETRLYVTRVMSNFVRYQWLKGGTAAVTPPPLELPKVAELPPNSY